MKKQRLGQSGLRIIFGIFRLIGLDADPSSPAWTGLLTPVGLLGTIVYFTPIDNQKAGSCD